MRNQPRGFTLIEMLVVIAIIGMLAGLLLPAINRARERGRQTQCISNMRQVAAAVQLFEDQQGRLPNYGTYARTDRSTDPDGVSKLDFMAPRHSWVVDVLPYLERSDIVADWTFGDPVIATPGMPPKPHLDGWPNQDRDADQSLDDLDNYALSHKHIGLLACPNDPSAMGVDGGLTYVVNAGYAESEHSHHHGNLEQSWYRTGLDWNGDGAVNHVDRQIKRKTGVFWAGSLDGKSVEDSRANLSYIQSGDGLTTTVMLAENTNAGFSANLGHAQDVISYDDYTWAYPSVEAVAFVIDARDICGSHDHDGDHTADHDHEPEVTLDCHEPYDHHFEFTLVNVEPGANEGDSPYPSSFHPGGVIVSFCDTSTRMLSDEVSPRVWHSLLTPRGGTLPMSHANDRLLQQTPLSESDY